MKLLGFTLRRNFIISHFVLFFGTFELRKKCIQNAKAIKTVTTQILFNGGALQPIAKGAGEVMEKNPLETVIIYKQSSPPPRAALPVTKKLMLFQKQFVF